MIHYTFYNFFYNLFSILFFIFGSLTEIQQAMYKMNREKTYKTYLKVCPPWLCSEENCEYVEAVKRPIFFILRIHYFQQT